MTLTLLYAALLWALLLLLHRTADKLLVAQAHAGVPSNADNRWAYRVYRLSRVALVTLALMFALCLGAEIQP